MGDVQNVDPGDEPSREPSGEVFRFLAALMLFTCALLITAVFADLTLNRKGVLTSLEARLDERGGQILLVGDSVIRATSSRDEDLRSVDGMLEARLQSELIAAPSSAFSPVVYRDLVESLEALKYRPATLVIPINLRSFSDSWYERPRYRFELERIKLRVRAKGLDLPALRTYLNLRFFSSLERSEELHAGAHVYIDGVDLGSRQEISTRTRIVGAREESLEGIRDYEDKVGLLFRINYMQEIHSDHPTLEDLLATLREARRLNIRTVTYFTPINVEDARRLLGPQFSTRFAQNKQVIAERLLEEGFELKDASELLPAARFIDKRYSCEHLDDRGRAALAEQIIGWVENDPQAQSVDMPGTGWSCLDQNPIDTSLFIDTREIGATSPHS